MAATAVANKVCMIFLIFWSKASRERCQPYVRIKLSIILYFPIGRQPTEQDSNQPSIQQRPVKLEVKIQMAHNKLSNEIKVVYWVMAPSIF